MKIAVMDLGTNSIHMQIVQVHAGGSFQVMGAEKDFTRLGDGSFSDGRLKPAAMQRALGVLSRFAKIAANRGVKRIVAFATSAVREASNGPELVLQIEKKTGIKVRVISGQEEARLIFRAVREGQWRDTGVWTMDIGGGSVEINAARGQALLFSESLKLGVARLRELHFLQDPPSRKHWERACKWVRKALKKALRHQALKRFRPQTLIGTSGTIQNLAQIAHRMHHKTPLLHMNGATLPAGDVKQIGRLLLETKPEQRAKIPGLDPTRQDQLLGGCVLLNEWMSLINVPSLTVCDKGIREGVVLDFIDRNRTGLRDEASHRDMRLRSVLALARRFDFDEGHARHVAKLALSLFDQTRALHRLDAEGRKLLEYAALLHDIGYHVSYPKHHKHGYYLIVHGGLDGFSPAEVEELGNIVRYHRKSFPKKTHMNFSHLNKASQRRVTKLAALLRLAEGLDRSHAQLVQALECRKSGKALLLKLRAKQDPELEIWGARQKQDLFEHAYRKPLRVRCWVRGKECVA